MDLQRLARTCSVDERFQSYNIEMVAVTGGNFWKPYEAVRPAPGASTETPDAEGTAGVDPGMFQYRPPRDLSAPRLRKLAAALGPSYVRVSGTWANSTYFADTDTPPAEAPEGFKGVLTRDQWRGVLDFADAVDAKIVTSFAISRGTRDGSGRWTPELAERWLDFTREVGGRVAAAEFMNEPNVAPLGGAPAGYSADDYGREFRAFAAFAERVAPEMVVLGPGSGAVGDSPEEWGDGSEAFVELFPSAGMLRTSDMLAATGPGVDAFSYHHYGAGSQRGAAMGLPQTTPDAATSEAWLDRTHASCTFYSGLRDEYEPGKPLWLTEVAESACGGNPWAGTFLDTFRYVDQLGRLAQEGVQVVMHNTLESSDYALLDEDDFTPRPNYWAAVLWRRLMGRIVLDPGDSGVDGVRVYAHSHRDASGGVSLVVLNTDREQSRTFAVPADALRYTLDADRLDSVRVRLNGRHLELDADDTMPELAGEPVDAGDLVLAPASITFLAKPDAANPACE
ncbi:hypothetical protein [Tomitella cavernea]|uniref:Glycosyl hydrolase family 79 n=1 Tax=Tomitella cavernea TaxID=1387982 RepID=A0ABP9CA51_9ACTN|nr:hypothetical protein [Tomitella cavernea]